MNNKKKHIPMGSTLAIVAGLMVFSLGMLSGEAAYGGPTAKCGSSTGASWDQALTGTCRFTVLADFGGAAVRDNETGLVWEKSPTAEFKTWLVASGYCLVKEVGGRLGWRLPAVVELASLVDRSVQPPGPVLPPGHPFGNIQSSVYWSASTVADFPTWARTVDIGNSDLRTDMKDTPYRVWCVRGPMQESVY